MKHIYKRLCPFITIVILAGQILSFFGLHFIDFNIDQNRNTSLNAAIASTDQEISEIFNPNKSFRFRNVQQTYQVNFIVSFEYLLKFAALIKYNYLSHEEISNKYYAHLSHNHSLRSPPAYI